jgi:thiol-disulfide isomerase/thioredoxin
MKLPITLKIVPVTLALLSANLFADQGQFWPKRLNGKLLTSSEPTVPVAPNKITALYMSASWCGPCKSFSPYLVGFRDRFPDAFQFVLLSHDRSLEDQSSYMANEDMRTPSVPCTATDEIRSLQKDARGSGIPQLIVYGADGHLITQHGRELIEQKQDPDKPRAWGDRQAQGYADWAKMLVQWQGLEGVREVTAGEYKQSLQKKYQTHAFWPIYVSSVSSSTRKPTGPIGSEANAQATKAAQVAQSAKTLVAKRAWPELWSTAKLVSEGDPMSGGLAIPAMVPAQQFFQAVGALASEDSSFRAACDEVPKSERDTFSYMLYAVAAAAATKSRPENADLFWKKAGPDIEQIANHSPEMLEPLLLAGDEKAYAAMAAAAKNRGYYYIMKPVLEKALRAGRKEAAAVLEVLEQSRR